MSDIIVGYWSKTGYTQRYAEWIATRLSADLVAAPTLHQLLAYRVVIVGGGVYQSGIHGVDAVKKNIALFGSKQLILFATGASPAGNIEVETILHANCHPNEQNRIHFFYFRGGFDFQRLHRSDKLLMTLYRAKLQAKASLTPDESDLLRAMNHPVDFTDIKMIDPLIELVEGEK